MSWEDLEWTPIAGLPVPQPNTPRPPKPDIPDDIEQRISAAGSRQGCIIITTMVGLACILIGSLVYYQQVVLHGHTIDSNSSAGGWLLLGFLGVIILPIFVGVLVRPMNTLYEQERIGLQWAIQCAQWVDAERAQYAAHLSPREQALLKTMLLPTSWHNVMLSDDERHVLAEHAAD